MIFFWRVMAQWTVLKLLVYGYFAIKYAIWDAVPPLLLLALCGVWFWLRASGRMRLWRAFDE